MTFRTPCGAILALTFAAAPAAAQVEGLRVEQHAASPAQAGNKELQIKATTSRTAVWIGDQIDLVIEATLAPNLDVLDDDLAKDKLKLTGIEVLSSYSERLPGEAGGTIRRFHYRLATYQVGAPALTIGPQPVRYYVRRPGEPPEAAKAEGEVQVPMLTIARRSTLPDELPGLDLRDAGALAVLPAWLQNARAIGIGLVAVAVAPLAVWLVAIGRAARTRRKRPSARVVRSHGRAALDELKAIDATSDAARLEAYTRLDQALRHHVAEARGIPAHALSASEIAARLGDAPSAVPTGELLAECERARYGPIERLPGADRFRAAVDRAEDILSTAS